MKEDLNLFFFVARTKSLLQHYCFPVYETSNGSHKRWGEPCWESSRTRTTTHQVKDRQRLCAPGATTTTSVERILILNHSYGREQGRFTLRLITALFSAVLWRANSFITTSLPRPPHAINMQISGGPLSLCRSPPRYWRLSGGVVNFATLLIVQTVKCLELRQNWNESITNRINIRQINRPML